MLIWKETLLESNWAIETIWGTGTSFIKWDFGCRILNFLLPLQVKSIPFDFRACEQMAVRTIAIEIRCNRIAVWKWTVHHQIKAQRSLKIFHDCRIDRDIVEIHISLWHGIYYFVNEKWKNLRQKNEQKNFIGYFGFASIPWWASSDRPLAVEHPHLDGGSCDAAIRRIPGRTEWLPLPSKMEATRGVPDREESVRLGNGKELLSPLVSQASQAP